MTEKRWIKVKPDRSSAKSTHGGNLHALAVKAGCREEDLLDFSASINPLGLPDELRKIISRSIERLVHYPDPGSSALARCLAGTLAVDPDQVVAANGSTEIIYALPRALTLSRAVIPVPAYLDYHQAALLAGLEITPLPLGEADGFRLNFEVLSRQLRDGDLVFLARPNNPTGVLFDASELHALCAARPGVFFLVDESFFAFCSERSELVSRDMARNLVVVRSLTKFYGIPGLRLGHAVMHPAVAELLRAHILPWTVNLFAQEVGAAIITDTEYGKQSRAYVRERRRELREALEGIDGLKVFPGKANFLLIRLTGRNPDARELAERLLARHRIAIRVCNNFDVLDERFFRVAVRSRAENEKLQAALADVLDISSRYNVSGTKKTQKTPALMLQGTSSNAGKSVLTAALCRIFLQDGLSVAPFKAQNMSLNSFVTRNGEEMGRAQVVQAQACRLDPDVRMNPVLLKPASDVGCQVIVNGCPVGNMSVDSYIGYKPRAAAAAREAYDSLAAEHDLVVLEGAGSPAEVNLKKHDIVNMNMARHADARVLLVGDIDRGGLFASFIGTLEVMAQWERDLVAGFVVNRFRGQASLLADAYLYTEEFTTKPVLGTIPYLRDLGLPEEDSVSFKAGLYDTEPPTGDHVVIGLIDLPHISNFTDVEPFLAEPDVHLLVIRTAEELLRAASDIAALILPGSKNVISDLAFLEQSGLAGAIHKTAGRDKVIVGICGGFQLLGKTIADPHGIESGGSEMEALGILDMVTSLAPEKTLVRRSTEHTGLDCAVHGYEIHHGRTVSNLPPVLRSGAGETDGAMSPDGRIWGTYLHGIFDHDQFRRRFIDDLRSRSNLAPLGRIMAPYDLEPAFDRLAHTVRKGLDMERIYRILGLK
jgi:cobyric acid synthase CobQ/L-threonine-O-3-phosphate decarboxylase